MPAPAAGSSAGASSGSSASAGSRCSVGHASGLANHTRLLSPAHETVAIATGASTLIAGDDPVGRAHPARAVARAAGVGRRQQDRGAEADRAGEPEHGGRRCPPRRSARRTTRRAAAATTSPHHPAARSRGLAPARAKPRESIDSASVTARSSPSSSTGTTWRSSRPRRTTRPPVRARSASRTSWMAASVDGTNASPTTITSPSSKNARGVDSTSSECDTTELNAPNTPITPTMAKPSASDCSITCSSTVPPTVKPPSSCGQPEVGRGEQHVADAVGRRDRQQHPHDREERTDREQQRERARVRPGSGVDRHRHRRDPDDQRDVHRARRELDARGRRQRPHQPHARVPRGPRRASARVCASADAGTVSAGLRRGRHCGLTCPLDNGCAQPGCCVRFPDLGPGTGEVGARPTLTRNCERLCGFCRTPRARLPAVVHRATGAPRRRATARWPRTRPSWKGASEDDMSHVRRAVACIVALTAALFTSRAHRGRRMPTRGDTRRGRRGVAGSRPSSRPTAASRSPRSPASRRSTTTLAIAETAQTGAAWSTAEAADRGRARCSTAARAHPVRRPRRYARPCRPGIAPPGRGQDHRARAAPLGRTRRLRSAATHAGRPRRPMGGSASPIRRSHFLYIAFRQRSGAGPDRPPPALDRRVIESKQQADGGVGLPRRPRPTDPDIDTTALAVEALVAGGADADRSRGARSAVPARSPPAADGRGSRSVTRRSENTSTRGRSRITAAGFDASRRAGATPPTRPGCGRAVRRAPTRGSRRSSHPNGDIARPNVVRRPCSPPQAVAGLERSWLPVQSSADRSSRAAPVTPTTPVTPIEPAVGRGTPVGRRRSTWP